MFVTIRNVENLGYLDGEKGSDNNKKRELKINGEYKYMIIYSNNYVIT